MRLKDKVAIITGAGSGIGQATAELFGEEGAKVVVVDIDRAAAQVTVQKILDGRGSAHLIQADISKEDDARNISAEAVKAYGRIDILVNNAATFVLKGFDATIEEWHRSAAVNLIGTAMVTKYTIEHLKRSESGTIVNVGSISSFVAQPDFFVYSSTKAAIVQMSRNMALDLGRYNIRVNSICPGTILTAGSFRHMENAGLTLEQFNAEEGARTFLGRVGQPREVACAILFLASDEASFITGASLMIDGGYTAQ